MYLNPTNKRKAVFPTEAIYPYYLGGTAIGTVKIPSGHR